MACALLLWCRAGVGWLLRARDGARQPLHVTAAQRARCEDSSWLCASQWALRLRAWHTAVALRRLVIFVAVSEAAEPGNPCGLPCLARQGWLARRICTAVEQRLTDLIDFLRVRSRNGVGLAAGTIPAALLLLHHTAAELLLRARARDTRKPQYCTAPPCCPGARCSLLAHRSARATSSHECSRTRGIAARRSASARRSAARSSARPPAWATTRASGASTGRRGSARRRASSRRRRSCAPCGA